MGQWADEVRPTKVTTRIAALKICECGDWLAHWSQYSGQALPSKCPVIDCPNKAEAAAHVQFFGHDPSWYVAPSARSTPHNEGWSSHSMDASDW